MRKWQAVVISLWAEEHRNHGLILFSTLPASVGIIYSFSFGKAAGT